MKAAWHHIGLTVTAGLMAVSGLAKPRSNEPIQPILPHQVANKAKVELGKMLFFDPRLSKSGTISCNSCHNLATGGVDNTKSSIGHGWSIGPINSPTVLNSKYNLAQFWDGRAKDLVDQAGGPIANPGEMASSHSVAVTTVASMPAYRDLFAKVYKSEPKIEYIQDAIASFEETLVTPDSSFDQWLKGDDKALTAEELKGYHLFKAKGCTGCHNGPAVGGTSFQKFGMVKPYKGDKSQLGRMAVTGKESDRFVFKVPTLRNIELTYPYFHDGSVWDLKEAVKIMADIQLGIPVSDQEADHIVAFLKTLTGKLAAVTLPQLPPSTAKTPRPDFSTKAAAH